MATDLFLIRHGEAVANVKPIIGGIKGDSGLTVSGREQAALVGEWIHTEDLRVDALYTSTMPRAQETATYIEKALDLEAIPDDVWQELRPGDADGLSVAEWLEKYGGKDFATGKDPYKPFSPGGESLSMFLIRVKHALGEVVARHPNQKVMIVCHAGVISASFYHAFAVDQSGRRVYFEPQNGSITQWRYEEQERGARKAGWTLVSFNDTSHLKKPVKGSKVQDAVPTPLVDTE